MSLNVVDREPCSGVEDQEVPGRESEARKSVSQQLDGLRLKLVISIDVEEEGLFCRRYSRRPSGVENVAHLRRIEPICRTFGVPVTLLVTHPVACNPSCQKILRFWRDELGAEIGAHLHPWSTPPFHHMARAEPVPSEMLPASVLGAKLESLVSALRRTLDVAPLAFRMGRFDFGSQVANLLPRYDFRVDSSIVPLRSVDGIDHFMAPPDPYWMPAPAGHLPVLEVPLTMVPAWSKTPRIVYRVARGLPSRLGVLLLTAFRHLAVLGIHPAWYPLDSMKWAARLHRRRGGRVLNIFLHSSELAPGATPRFTSEAAVRRTVNKMEAFLGWLFRTGPVQPVQLSELCSEEGLPRLQNGAAMW